jgi:glutaredoxin-like protein NrdH
MEEVTVYHIGPACVQCNQTKRLMDRLGIKYSVVDLRENPEMSEKFINEGYKTAPVVTAGKQIWAGFNVEKINSLADF